MPTYQYRCQNCGHELEAKQSFTDDPLSICPECDGPLRKLFSAAGVVFKGSGFYRNDARSKPDGAASSSSTSASGTGSSPAPAAAPSPSKSSDA